VAAKVITNPVEVGNRLEELHLTREQILDVVDAMVSAKADCTPNDPAGAPGWSAWRMGVRRLREVVGTQDGWEKDEVDQIPGVINKELGIRLTVANTDDATGLKLEDRRPQNWSRKGAATDRIMQVNQGSFMGALEESLKVVQLKPTPKEYRPIVTWYICTYCEGDEFRAELSCPAGLDNGYFTDFIERIVIVGSEAGDEAPVRRRKTGEDDGSEFDVPVTRKK
jgi:hypothetical protein